jgi:hypothetical protein
MKLLDLKDPKDMTPGERRVRRETMLQMSLGILVGGAVVFRLLLWLLYK